jgi:predicted TIM-barrel fold metal-dependent hydrolase
MVIDAHTHVYLRPAISSNPKRWVFMSVESQIAFMDELGIDKAIILPLNNAEAPAECQSHGEMLTIRDRYPGRFVLFCNIDPRLPRDPRQSTVEDCLHYLEQYKEQGCHGLGELTARIRWDHPLMRNLLRACEIVGFPVTFHMTLPHTNGYGVIDDPDFAGLERALADFPDLVFLGHSPAFWRGISGGESPAGEVGYPSSTVAPGGPVLRLFRTYPNLYGDLSGGSGLTALTRDPSHAYGFLNDFADRLVFGLDCNSPRHSTDLMPFLKAACDNGHISRAVREKIFSGNIVRLLGL